MSGDVGTKVAQQPPSKYCESREPGLPACIGELGLPACGTGIPGAYGILVVYIASA